jgi:hypothetical protein
VESGLKEYTLNDDIKLSNLEVLELSYASGDLLLSIIEAAGGNIKSLILRNTTLDNEFSASLPVDSLRNLFKLNLKDCSVEGDFLQTIKSLSPKLVDENIHIPGTNKAIDQDTASAAYSFFTVDADTDYDPSKSMRSKQIFYDLSGKSLPTNNYRLEAYNLLMLSSTPCEAGAPFTLSQYSPDREIVEFRPEYSANLAVDIGEYTKKENFEYYYGTTKLKVGNQPIKIPSYHAGEEMLYWSITNTKGDIKPEDVKIYYDEDNKFYLIEKADKSNSRPITCNFEMFYGYHNITQPLPKDLEELKLYYQRIWCG